MARRTLISASAFLMLHLVLIAIVNDRFSVVWLELPLLVVFAWLARKGKVAVELALCLATASAFQLAEPAVGVGPVIWIALVPLFEVVQRQPKFRILAGWGLWTGLLIATGIYAWMWRAVVTFFETSLIAALPLYFLISLAIAAQFVIFLPLARIFLNRSRIPFYISAPLLYVLIEYWMPLPLPIALGLAFAQQPLLLQPADIAGLHGISLLVALVNAALWYAFQQIQSSQQRRAILATSSAVAIMAIHALYGLWCMQHYAPRASARAIDIAMIQPMSPLRVMNTDTKLQEESALNLEALSLEACRSETPPPDLLLWPEGAGAFASRTPQFNPAYMAAVTRVQQETSVPLVAQDIEFFRPPGSEKLRYYSTISLIEPVGKSVASYRKNILMPFGEYLPLERYLPVLRRLLPQARSILKGEESLPLAGPRSAFAPLICFEVLYPKHASSVLGKDAGYLINLTNDRWYGKRQQPVQHLTFAVLRAIENRRPLARATNSGISAIIDARGLIPQELKTTTMKKTWLRGEVEPRSGYTFYNRFGVVLFPIALTGGVALLLFYAMYRPLYQAGTTT